MLSLHDPSGVPILRLTNFGRHTRERLHDTHAKIAFRPGELRPKRGRIVREVLRVATIGYIFHLKNRWLCGTISVSFHYADT
ncbi:hypothetical protein ACVWZ4_000357 [Bradyrhizobium sp. USDA 4472]